MELKMNYYQAIKYLYLGNESVEKERWGEAVVYLQTANDLIVACAKIAKVCVCDLHVHVHVQYM